MNIPKLLPLLLAICSAIAWAQPSEVVGRI
jgi:hypothetical protein